MKRTIKKLRDLVRTLVNTCTLRIILFTSLEEEEYRTDSLKSGILFTTLEEEEYGMDSLKSGFVLLLWKNLFVPK